MQATAGVGLAPPHLVPTRPRLSAGCRNGVLAVTDGTAITRPHVRRRRPPSPLFVWAACWYAVLLGMVASAVFHLAQDRDPPLWISAAVLFGLQTVHVHRLYLETARMAARDQPVPRVETSQWAVLSIAVALMLVSFFA